MESKKEVLLPNGGYTFDLSIFENIKTPELLDHIERAGKSFYKRVRTP